MIGGLSSCHFDGQEVALRIDQGVTLATPDFFPISKPFLGPRTPIAESSALVIPTAWYASPGGLAGVSRLIHGVARSPLCELGWKSLGVLDLTALPSIQRENWVPLIQEVDALLVGGGEVLYLCYWMWQSGLADLLPQLGQEAVYVGLSGRSMVVTPPIGVYDDPK